jgi:hypothetical protein
MSQNDCDDVATASVAMAEEVAIVEFLLLV